MVYTPKNFKHLLGTPGFSNALLEDHFKLYEGYVANVNKIEDLLNGARAEKRSSPEYSELRRRLSWEWNGMRLHEYYFGNMSRDRSTLNRDYQELESKLVTDFGSYSEWEKDFLAAGKMRGIGWVVLTYDASLQVCVNIWVTEHDEGLLAGAIPLLVMDIFEHAYILDYGIEKEKYIEKFMQAIAWDAVSDRFRNAQALAQVAPELLAGPQP